MTIEYPDRTFIFDTFISNEYEGEPQEFEENTSEWIEIDELLKKECQKYLSEKILFREHLLYALRKNKSKISQELDYLSELKTQNVFQPNLMRLRFKIIWWLANHRLLCLAELVAKL